MCAASAVTDYYREHKWPTYVWPEVPEPYIIPTPDPLNGVWISKAEWEEYKELKRRMEDYDKQTHQPDCIKPEVAEWEEVVENVLRKRGIIE